MGVMKQFVLMLSKNWKVSRRKVVATVFEIILPIIFTLLLLVIRAASSTTDHTEMSTWASFQVNNLTNVIPNGKDKLLYYPNETKVIEIMTTLQTALGSSVTVTGYTSVSDILTYVESNKAQVWAAVVFDDGDYSTTLPNAVRYSLRVAFTDTEQEWYTEYNYPFFRQSGYRNNDSSAGEPFYESSGFLALQYAIDKAIIDIHHPTNNMSGIALSLERMAYPPFIEDNALDAFKSTLPLLLILTYIVTVFQTAKNIVQEKESRIKESMKLMGLSPTVYWVSWFMKVFLYIFITDIFFTIMFKIKIGGASILNNSSPALIFFFLLFFGISIICFCFLIATIFQTANGAAYAAAILYFLTYIPFTFLDSRYADMSTSQKLAASLLNNVGMSFGVLTIALYEATGDGAQFTNFASPATQDDNFSLLQAMLMMIGDSFIYLIFAWYLENVRPGNYGIPKPLYFPFTRDYWCGYKASDEIVDIIENNDGDTFEPEPGDLTVGINMSHLRKEFGRGKNKKVAVSDTSLNMYEGQITVLLGHNGAGKTTTMSMLTGFIPPTSGTAIVNGCDIRKNIEGVRKSLGLCPQHNILFDLLTVEEHLELYAKLKDVPSSDIKNQINNMLNILGLQFKKNKYSHTLSGGQKRKLSVGIALIGDSKVVVLDEPTSGMDPSARRETWDILQGYREGRTILLTTHFMDEADLLGDRIAIMADGVVKCCGTSHFLKKKYGAGYHLVIVKSQSCDVSKLTSVIQNHVPRAVLESNISAELSYLLPFDESAKFEQLFNELEKRATEFGLSSFGTTATTMEEVFLKVGEGAKNEDEDENDEEDDSIKETGKINHHEAMTSSLVNHEEKPVPTLAFGEEVGHSYEKVALPPINNTKGNTIEMTTVNSTSAFGEEVGHSFKKVALPPINNTKGNTIEMTTVNSTSGAKSGLERNKGMILSVQQFYGMFVKKLIHTKRNVVVTIVQLCLPVVFTILALLVAEISPTQVDEPALDLTLAPFKKAQVVTYSAGKAASTTFTSGVTSIYQSLFSAYETVDYDSLTYSSMNSFFVAKSESIGTSTFENKYVIAGEFGSDTAFKAYFNGEAYHSPGITLAYLMTTMLQLYKGSGYSITTVNHPLPLTLAEKSNQENASGIGFSVAFFTIFGMSFLTTSFVIFLVRERNSGAKHLQKVSGVSSLAYWLSNYCWDIINYHIPVFLLLIIFAGYQTPAYVYDNRLGIVFLLFVIYGLTCLPFVYCFQFLFSVPSTAMVTITMINIITGLASLLTVFLLDIFNASTAADAVDWACTVIMPHYCLGQALNKMFVNYDNIKTCTNANFELLCSIDNTISCCSGCTTNCIDFQTNYLAWSNPGVLKYLIFMLLQLMFLWCVVFVIEYGLFERIMYLMRKKKSSHTSTVAAVDEAQLIDDANEDSDVSEERRRINQTDLKSLMETDALIVKNLSKTYGQHRAVRGINIGVAKQECFGLLGQNGAGKTSTFKMLTGDVTVTNGNAYLNSYDIQQHLRQVQQNVGYCPQFDALIDQMTGRETLYMYARLRGVQEKQIPQLVDDLIKVVMLKKYAEKNCANYSGGNKRKLSTAIALIGDPPFVLLDEPTTGMDPAARRKLWNVLSDVRASGRTLVLTSHSMEECDALCTKIVIMVNGKFVCLGSPQHLKNKFGQGYTLVLRLGTDSARLPLPSGPVKDFIKQKFPSSEIFDDHQGYVHFQIPDANVPLGKVFSAMESAKEQFKIEDYAVHQTTLEQVFLTFTRNQAVPVNTKKKVLCGILCCPDGK